MWLHRLTNYLLQHRWQSTLLAFLTTFVPIIGVLGILVGALFTLVQGIAVGAIVTIAATIPYIISFYFTHATPTESNFLLWGVGIAVISNLLTYFFAVSLRRNPSWSTLLQGVTLFGVLVVSVVHLVYPKIGDWWGRELQNYATYAQTMAANTGKTIATATKEAQLETINLTKEYATGLITATILLFAITQLICARWWQSLIFTPGSLRQELHNIRLSQLAGILFVGSTILSYLGNRVALDIMPLLYLLFGAAGLSLIHYFFGKMESPTAWFWLMLLYLALIFTLPTSVIIVAMVGLFDIWINLRKRISKA